MARQHADDVQYRAVITTTFPDVVRDGNVLRAGFVRTEHYGPYPKRSTAATQITRERNAYTRSDVTVVGHVEVGQVIWTPEGQETAVELISTAELEALRDADRDLDALHRWGVDNWEGYGDALSDKDPDA